METPEGSNLSRSRDVGDAGRCSKQSSKRRYTKRKRIFYGNRHTKSAESSTSKKTPVSVQKIKTVKRRKICKNEGFRLVDIGILEDMVSSLACPECFENDLYLEEDHSKKKGLAVHISIKCSCGYVKNNYMSKTNVDDVNTSKGMKPFEVNTRMVYALRTCGLGHKGLEKMCCIMNMPKPMTITNFDKISNKVRDAAKDIAEVSMNASAAELCKGSPETTDIGVTVDGTWQRRGYSSMNGVVVAMSVVSGKVVDIEPLSRFCKACSTMTRNLKDDVQQLVEWEKDHKESCKVNYSGTAPAMEVEGAKRIFGRSIEKRNLRYTEYYGDGDSKAYEAVKVTSGLYCNVKKLECIGHYQKRVGCRLRKLKKNKGLKVLTPVIMDKLQNYFGIALRANCTTVEAMQKAIWASFFHVASSEKNNYHSHCEASPTSWCQYQRDVINKTNLYKPGLGFSKEVIAMVKPIYIDLIKPTELGKCLHGKTQNQNENFNSTLWERVPKTNYCAFDKLELAVYDAVGNFNDGKQASIDILKYLNISPGYHTATMCFEINKRRKYLATYKANDTTKKARKIIRAERKRKGSSQKDLEGTVYKAGAF